MPENYPIPLKEVRTETRVMNSHFIATLVPVFSVEEAKAFISRIRLEFGDASHNVPIYLIGHGASVIAHCSDDGEPSGTAGRPGLAVLSGSGLGDVAVVVTRYFGGTKLGTGGLVRAYSDAVRQVVELATRGMKVQTCSVMIALPYKLLERLRLLVGAHRGTPLAEDFGSEVTLTARFPLEAFPAFQDGLRELSNGTLQAEIIETGETVMPIET